MIPILEVRYIKARVYFLPLIKVTATKMMMQPRSLKNYNRLQEDSIFLSKKSNNIFLVTKLTFGQNFTDFHTWQN